MYILGIETSCDETAAAVLKIDQGRALVLSNIISSQIEIHKKYYGVVPEIAAREHVLNIIPVVNEALVKAKIKSDKITAIAVTTGPGLVTSLISGVETAKILASAWKKPLISVNHIAGHIYANFIEPKNKIKFPALVLTVSGGHTNLVLMTGHLKFKVIGETLDDAAGEAYDKGAKMLNIGYPGGPIVAKFASEFSDNSKIQRFKDSKIKNIEINLPRPMLNKPTFNFSFSGLKTALLYQLQKDKNWKNRIPEYCFALQQAVNETLIKKTIKAAIKYKVKTVMLSGGVAANKDLRESLASAVKNELNQVAFSMPSLAYTTDNAVMVAMAGYYKFKAKKFILPNKLRVDCNLELK